MVNPADSWPLRRSSELRADLRETQSGDAIASGQVEEGSIMRITTLFERTVFIRLCGNDATFICTEKCPLFSVTKRVALHDAESRLAGQDTEAGLMEGQELRLSRVG